MENPGNTKNNDYIHPSYKNLLPYFSKNKLQELSHSDKWGVYFTVVVYIEIDLDLFSPLHLTITINDDDPV